jgi:hypothetical protein
MLQGVINIGEGLVNLLVEVCGYLAGFTVPATFRKLVSHSTWELAGSDTYPDQQSRYNPQRGQPDCTTAPYAWPHRSLGSSSIEDEPLFLKKVWIFESNVRPLW